MPLWSDGDKVIGNKKSNVSKYFKCDDLPIICNFKCKGLEAHIKESKKKLYVSVFAEDSQRVALFIFKKTRLGVEASWSAIYKTHQGLGIGKRVYGKIISLYGKLVSSPTLTGKKGYGSFNLYKSLGKRKQVYLMNAKTGTMKPVRVTKEQVRYAVERFVIVA